MNPNLLVFLDIETTGLDPVRDAILEVGWLIVKKPFLEVVHCDSIVLSCPLGNAKTFQDIPPKVVEMHTKNGLWDACISDDAFPGREEAQQYISDSLLSHGAQNCVMAGFNPTFDRSFLEHHMPRLHELFHYRSLDINSFWLVQEMFGQGAPKSRTHRALADCYAALKCLQDFPDWVIDYFRASGGALVKT